MASMHDRNGRPISFLQMSSSSLTSFENLINLSYLYDELVVDCILSRYEASFIYTWAGPILVAVNPIKKINYLYSVEKISAIHSTLKSGVDFNEPHIYTVAGIANSRMINELGLINQAILVSGESGSGKTESSKYILKYLTEADKGNLTFRRDISSSDSFSDSPRAIQNQILTSNPILEAFGNASTLRNSNSSRFGKFIRLLYKGQRLEGALIETYLLEKTRVTSQPRKERNFHIFYQLLAGVRNGLVIKDLCLDPDEVYSIVPDSVKLNDDFEPFKATLKALDEIGTTAAEQEQIFKVVVALMHLGNVTFESLDSEDSWSVQSTAKKFLSKASVLLGISSDLLSEVFTTRKIAVICGGKTTIYNKACERKDQCEARRDSFIQLIYSSLFTYLVSFFNAKNCPSVASTNGTCLGILDIYGFEAFEQNSLEQLCINYTNERLQQEFTRRFIAMENKILMEEGFLDVPFTYMDNANCVSALDSKLSVFAILNEECQLKRSLNEESACYRVCSALESSGIVSSLTPRRSGFAVKHYAGDVAYYSEGLLHKNKDEISEDILDLLGASKNEFVSSLLTTLDRDCAVGGDSLTQRKRKTRKTTTLAKFKGSLDSLVRTLSNCDLHYVRCVKPNADCLSNIPNRSFLLNQLLTNGILETVRISQFGYPVRLLYCDFLDRYNLGSFSLELEKKQICTLILDKVFSCESSQFVVNQSLSHSNQSNISDKFRLGLTRIFLSESALHELEQRRYNRRNEAALCIQKNFKKFYCFKEYNKLRNGIIKAQRVIRCRLCRIRFLRLRSSVILIQSRTRSYLTRKQFCAVKHSVILLQKYVRGWLCRQKYATVKSKKLIRNGNHVENSIDFSIKNYSSRSAYHDCPRGYSTLTSSLITDYSAFDLDVVADSINGECLKTFHRNRSGGHGKNNEGGGGGGFLETEESGIETDTESLSGEKYKIGRLRSKNVHHHHHSSRAKISDEDLTSSAETLSNTQFRKQPAFSKHQISDELPVCDKIPVLPSRSKICEEQFSVAQTSNTPLKANIPDRQEFSAGRMATLSSTRFPYQLKCTDSSTVLHGIFSKEQISSLSNVVSFPNIGTKLLKGVCETKGCFVYYKDGILSYRYLIGKIIFHTRSTCLPFSTSLPFYALSKGFIDLIE